VEKFLTFVLLAGGLVFLFGKFIDARIRDLV